MVLTTLNPNLTVKQAYDIDQKLDDGLPQGGDVTACYLNANIAAGAGYAIWAAGSQTQGAHGAGECTPTTAATAYATTNCYDNNNLAGTQQYSLAQNGNQPNCALSFRFQ